MAARGQQRHQVLSGLLRAAGVQLRGEGSGGSLKGGVLEGKKEKKNEEKKTGVEAHNV